LGEDRSNPRLYYFEGTVEIVSASEKQQEIKCWIGSLMAQFFIAKGIRAYPRGQATIKKLKDAGAEPDESWTFGERKEVPDLVLEIALTSGGVPKLELYQRLEVPEVWFWRKGQIEVWTLKDSGYTGPHPVSELLPEMPLAELQTHAQMEDWMQAVQSFRALVEQGRS
jgi:Uma2 family endonuclease